MGSVITEGGERREWDAAEIEGYFKTLTEMIDSRVEFTWDGLRYAADMQREAETTRHSFLYNSFY